ncbi:MAG: WbqC family protein [Saprospiraceae bacterium]|nr:WbqC family protein [Saprospiraceae bacterium]
MKVAIHQPNYFPWLGYFYKMYLSDTFVFHDSVALSKRTYARRTRILQDKGKDATRWLTVPLQQHTSATAVADIQVDHAQDWQRAHLNKIRNAYAGSPFFAMHFPLLQDLLHATRDFPSLAEMNIQLIQTVAAQLAIRPTCRRSTDLQVSATGSALNIGIVRMVGGDTYISGTGARSYQTSAEFDAAGIQLLYHAFGETAAQVVDTQAGREGLAQLSVVHAMMEIGIEGIVTLFESCARAQTRQLPHT